MFAPTNRHGCAIAKMRQTSLPRLASEKLWAAFVDPVQREIGASISMR